MFPFSVLLVSFDKSYIYSMKTMRSRSREGSLAVGVITPFQMKPLLYLGLALKWWLQGLLVSLPQPFGVQTR